MDLFASRCPEKLATRHYTNTFRNKDKELVRVKIQTT